MNYTKRLYILILIVGTILLLIYAQSLILPFILAVLIWFVIRVIKRLLKKIKFVDKLPNWLLTTFSALVLLSALGGVVTIITTNIQQLSESMPVYEANMNKVGALINSTFSIDLRDITKNYASKMNFSSILSSLFSSLTNIFSDGFTILLYLIFILLEESIFPSKLKAVYKDPDDFAFMNSVLSKIDQSISYYIALKTFTSILTGLLSFFVLLIIGIDGPFFWAFIIFILNFIPTIGSLIATLFPSIFAMLQFGDFTPAVLILSIVGAIQLIVGNLVEPRLMGNSLNISTLVVFLSLVIWGTIWGIPGMLLSVPITAIIILILSNFPNGRPVAIMLSKKGEIFDWQSMSRKI